MILATGGIGFVLFRHMLVDFWLSTHLAPLVSVQLALFFQEYNVVLLR